MELSFERADILQTEPLSNVGTMKLLPFGKKQKQKLAIGDDSGNVASYDFKKGEPLVVFSMKLFDAPVTSISVGGANSKRDKIFASAGQKIVGVTKKGKEFFKLSSSVTETINHIFVEDTKIYTGCEFVYSSYDNGNDVAYYMCHDHINAMLMEHVTRDDQYNAVLGCQDNCIRIISESSVVGQIGTQAPVTAIGSFYGEESKLLRATSSFVYSTNNGLLTNILVNNSGVLFNSIWTVADKDKVPVKSMKIYDITQDGVNEVIVGRDDGRVEVLVMDPSQQKPRKVFGRTIGESVMSVDTGKLNSTEFNEIILAGYSGKIVSFTSEPTQARAAEDTYGRSVQAVNNENRMKHLKKEIELLKQKVEKEKDKLKAAQSKATDASQAVGVADFPINASFLMNADEASYVLTLEIQNPIDIVVLRSPVHLDLIDAERGSALVSVTAQTPTAGEAEYRFVATYRCQAQERRVCIAMRTMEGEFGDVLITVVTAGPTKAAKVIKFPLKALSLHSRVHSLSEAEENRPRSKIKFTGPASLSILHEWVLSLFPDVPSRIDENSTGERYIFRNTFTSSYTICTMKKYDLVFESENPSTIAIIRENILRLATARRIQLEDSSNLVPATIESFLSLIRDRLEYQLSLSRKFSLIDSIREITLQETDTRWLSPEYASILRDEDKIRKEYASREKTLESIIGIITDLFVDWYKLKGRDVRHMIPQVQEVILNGNFDAIVSTIRSAEMR